MQKEYDVIILGGGSAGINAAYAAAGQGAKTCIVTKGRLGGECTWNGCVPSKTLLKTAKVVNSLKQGCNYGFMLQGSIDLDINTLLNHARNVEQAIGARDVPQRLEDRGIDVTMGEARFTGNLTIEVNGKEYRSKRFIVCTGSKPFIPEIEGLDTLNYFTNDNIFELKEMPESVVVLGGGAVGVEYAQVFERFGAKVTLIEMNERILADEDAEVVGILEKSLSAESIHIKTGRKAVRAGMSKGKVSVEIEDKNKNNETVNGQMLFIAAGRIPDIEMLDLMKAGIEYTDKGLKVNEYLQTTNKNVFACGDVLGYYLFSNVAAYQARLCVQNALYKRPVWEKVNYENASWSVFTDPELAHLGMTEKEAHIKVKDMRVFRAEYKSSDRAYTDNETVGLLKVITDKNEHIVGAHIVGAMASEIMQGIIVARGADIKFSRLARMMYIYPTLSEVVKNAAGEALTADLDEEMAKIPVEAMKNI